MLKLIDLEENRLERGGFLMPIFDFLTFREWYHGA